MTLTSKGITQSVSRICFAPRWKRDDNTKHYIHTHMLLAKDLALLSHVYHFKDRKGEEQEN